MKEERPAIPAAPHEEVQPGPKTVQDARRAVERSRARIAATLEELEDRIVETKESIRRKADVARPARNVIRKAPLIAIGVGVAVGLLLGARGGSDDDEEEDDYGWEKKERKALEEWRKRRRKLLMDEVEDAGDYFEEEVETDEPGPVGRFMRTMGHELGGVLAGIIAAEIAERFYGGVKPRDAKDGEDEDGDVESDDDVEYADDDDAEEYVENE